MFDTNKNVYERFVVVLVVEGLEFKHDAEYVNLDDGIAYLPVVQRGSVGILI